MSDSEKPLKVISGIVSGLLVVSALLFLIFALGKPKEAEAELEYSAPAGFDSSELTSALYQLRKDQGFLVEVATRSKFANASDPELAQVAAKLGSRLTFEANLKEPTISIRFAHPEAATAMNVANAVAAVAKERLESQQQKLRMDLLAQEDDTEDKRKLVLSALSQEEQGSKSPWSWSSADAKVAHEKALRQLKELKAKPVFSIGSIRAAKLTSD